MRPIIPFLFLSLAAAHAADLIIPNTSKTDIDLSGSHQYGNMIYESGTPAIGINLRYGASLTLNGAGIIDYSTNSELQILRLRENSSLRFEGNAMSGFTRILNYSGHIVFAENSFATPFSVISNDGNSINGSPTTITFKDQSSTLNATFYNSGSQASIIFEGNSTMGVLGQGIALSSTVYNIGVGSLVHITANASTVSSNVINSGRGAKTLVDGHAILGQYEAGTSGNNSTFTNNGVDALLHITGDVFSENVNINSSGSWSTVIIDGNFTTNTTGLFRLNTSGASVNAAIKGNAIISTNSITINNNSTKNATLLVGENATINGTGSIYSGGNGPEGNSSTVLITDNATIGGSMVLRNNGTYSELFIRGNASVKDSANIYNYGENTIMRITEGANISSSASINTYGNHTLTFIEGNAKITGGATIRNNGTNSTLVIGGESEIRGASNIYLTGINTQTFITENATINSTASINNYGDQSMLVIDGNADISGGVTIRNNGTNSTLEIKGNSSITGSSLATVVLQISSTNQTKTYIGGNATLSNLTINASNEGTLIRFEDYANVTNTRLELRNGAKIEVAMGEGATPLQFAQIYAPNAAGATFHFTGPMDQELILGNDNANLGNLSFTDDGNIRGSITKMGTGTLTLNKSNTLRGNITVNAGILTINNTTAVDTATVVINTGGNINYGTAASSAAELNFGGLGGNGIFYTTRNGSRDYRIGNNSYDSVFTGNITGSGNITKTGNGTLLLDGTDVSTYTGIVVVESGVLAINSVSFANTGSPFSVGANATLGIQGSSYIPTLSLDNDTAMNISYFKSTDAFGNSSIVNGQLNVDRFVDAEVAKNILYYTTAESGSEALQTGDQLKAFMVSPDSNITNTTEDIVTRSTNTLSFSLNISTNSTNATLHDYTLTAMRNSLADYALNVNQASIASAIDTLMAVDANNPIAQAADLAADPTLVFDMINPAGLSSMARLVYQQTNTEIDSISSRLDAQRHFNSTSYQNSRLSDTILRVSSNIRSFQLPTSSLFASTATVAPTGESHNMELSDQFEKLSWSAYLAASASFGDLDGDKDAAGYDTRQAGITLGLDKAMGANEGIAGFQISYHKSKAELDKPSEGTVKLNSIRLAGYAGWLNRSNISIQSHLSLSYHDYETERHTFGGLSAGDAKAYGAALSGELGKLFEASDAWKHGPYLRIAYDYLRIDSFTESGALSSLHYSSQTPDSLRSTLGWKLFYECVSQSGISWLFNARLGWAHEYNNPNQSISAHFADYNMASFTVRGPDTRRDSLTAALGLQIISPRGRFLALQYQGDLNGNLSIHSFNAAFGWRF